MTGQIGGPPTVLVVQHEDLDPVGKVETWLAEVGVACRVVAAHRGEDLPEQLGEHAGLLVLGGEMGADDDQEHAWLTPTKGLVAATVAAGRPLLGICLGHQLISVALGGRVGRNPHGPTRALHPFAPTGAGRRDALTAGLAAGTDVLHWNDDVVLDLPAGAVVLSTSPDGTVQAARFGPRAWGVQFHPEVSASTVAGWGHGRACATERAVMAELDRREGELHAAWARLARRFGELTLAR